MSSSVWTVAEAKAKFSQVMEEARDKWAADCNTKRAFSSCRGIGG